MLTPPDGEEVLFPNQILRAEVSPISLRTCRLPKVFHYQDRLGEAEGIASHG